MVTASCSALVISSHAVAHSAAALALLWGLLLSGFLVPLDELATSEWWLLRRMRDFFPVPVRYAYEALMVNEFEGVDALIITTSIGGGEPVKSNPISGEEMLRCLGFHPDAKDADLNVLAMWLGALLVAVGLLLRFYVREAR